MKKQLFVCIGILALLVLNISLTGQTIERKMGQYILIDTDINLGSVKDTLYVMKIHRNMKKEVGKAVIVKFNQGKTAALMKAGQAEVGDKVSKLSLTHMESISKSVDLHKQSYFSIQKVFKGYVLIGPGATFSKGNQTLIVKRNTQFGYIDIGTVNVIKTQNGKTAAKIIREISPYKIEQGDVVLGKTVSSEKNVIDVLSGELIDDIDYYFFGPYDPDH